MINWQFSINNQLRDVSFGGARWFEFVATSRYVGCRFQFALLFQFKSFIKFKNYFFELFWESLKMAGPGRSWPVLAGLGRSKKK